MGNIGATHQEHPLLGILYPILHVHVFIGMVSLAKGQVRIQSLTEVADVIIIMVFSALDMPTLSRMRYLAALQKMQMEMQ